MMTLLIVISIISLLSNVVFVVLLNGTINVCYKTESKRQATELMMNKYREKLKRGEKISGKQRSAE